MNTCLTGALLAALLAAAGLSLAAPAAAKDDEALKKIREAVPDEPIAKPARPRKLLVFTKTAGFRHDSIPVGVAALRILGEKTGAFTITHSEDTAALEPESLEQYDAVCFLNTTGELFRPRDFDSLPGAAQTPVLEREQKLQSALLEFVRGGKGFVGIHAATDTCYKWHDYGGMIGGYFDGHPWNAGDDVVIRVDEPQHPVAAPIGATWLELKEEIYQLKDPYSRDRQRVLLSLDTERTDMTRPGIRRTDKDFAVSWVRTEGRGRVFYCSLGHNAHIYRHPQVLKHYLAGIQYALGDLEADATPSSKSPPAGKAEFVPLFNGRDLTGWKGLVGNPVTRAAMSADELAAQQSVADAGMRAHWKVRDGMLVFDGKGENICTAQDYGDFELMLDWKIEPGGDSGIYLRGTPQVQIWDHTTNPVGSGGLYNNESHPKDPLVCADNPVGEWNTFEIRMVGPRVTVRLNGKLVVDDVPLENYWERGKPIDPAGPIELQAHGSPLYFRNIRIRPLK